MRLVVDVEVMVEVDVRLVVDVAVTVDGVVIFVCLSQSRERKKKI